MKMNITINYINIDESINALQDLKNDIENGEEYILDIETGDIVYTDFGSIEFID